MQLGIGILTVIVAFLVMRNGFRSTTKVDQAARRTEWWKRTQWAIDLALDGEERKQEVGVLALNQLLDSELAQQTIATSPTQSCQRSFWKQRSTPTTPTMRQRQVAVDESVPPGDPMTGWTACVECRQPTPSTGLFRPIRAPHRILSPLSSPRWAVRRTSCQDGTVGFCGAGS